MLSLSYRWRVCFYLKALNNVFEDSNLNMVNNWLKGSLFSQTTPNRKWWKENYSYKGHKRGFWLHFFIFSFDLIGIQFLPSRQLLLSCFFYTFFIIRYPLKLYPLKLYPLIFNKAFTTTTLHTTPISKDQTYKSQEKWVAYYIML